MASDGRGYPDISAQGLYFGFVWNQTFSSISGTSASTPLSASIIALVNDALLAAGKPTLGFLNPFLYSKAYKAFTDITSGNTSSCGTAGFPVTKGWDPTTGFGSPVSIFIPTLLTFMTNDGFTGLPGARRDCEGVLLVDL